MGVAQDLDLPDATFDVVTCTLAMHRIPVRKREAALAVRPEQDTDARA